MHQNLAGGVSPQNQPGEFYFTALPKPLATFFGRYHSVVGRNTKWLYLSTNSVTPSTSLFCLPTDLT